MAKRKMLKKQMLIPGVEYNNGGGCAFAVRPEQQGGLSGGTQYRWEISESDWVAITVLINVPFCVSGYYFLITTLPAKTSKSNPGQRGMIYFIEEVPDPRTEVSQYLDDMALLKL